MAYLYSVYRSPVIWNDWLSSVNTASGEFGLWKVTPYNNVWPAGTVQEKAGFVDSIWCTVPIELTKETLSTPITIGCRPAFDI